MLFTLVQTLYWLALAAWFGGTLFLALAAPIVFRSVRDADPTLPRVLAVNLDGQHAMLLAGSIVLDLLGMVQRVSAACAAVVLLGLGAHWALLDAGGLATLQMALRCGLFIAAAGLLVYDWRVLAPRLRRTRDRYVDHADEPEVANAALDEYDRLHQLEVGVLRNLLFVLMGLVLFSALIAAPARTIALG